MALEGVVVVEFGPEKRAYYIHKALLIHHSDFFRKALLGPWRESEEGIVKLHDVETAVGMMDVLHEARS